MELQVENLILKINKRQITGAFQTTLETAKITRNIIAGSRWSTYEQLVKILQDLHKKLDLKVEFAAASTVCRILKIIHDENLVLEETENVSYRDSIKPFVIQGINEMIDEVESSASSIASNANEQISVK